MQLVLTCVHCKTLSPGVTITLAKDEDRQAHQSALYTLAINAGWAVWQERPKGGRPRDTGLCPDCRTKLKVFV